MSQDVHREAALSAARAKVGAEAKAMVAAARGLADRAGALLLAPHGLRAVARHQVSVMTAERAASWLASTSLDALNDVVVGECGFVHLSRPVTGRSRTS